MPEPRPLRRNRDFKVLLTSQAISAVGDAVTFTALPLLVLALTGSGLMMGIVGALGMLPDLFFGMVAGALADRGDRRRMMLLADLGRAGLTALIPLSVLLGGPTIAVILIVVAPLSILRALFIAGYSASVPMLVGRSDLGRALSIFEAIYSFGFIIGPAIAGSSRRRSVRGRRSPSTPMSFVLSSLAIAFMRPLRPPADRPPASLVADIREGIDYIVGHAALRSIILFWGLVAITTAPLVTVLAVLVTRDHGYDEAVLGLVLTAFGVGTVVGALLTARAKRRPVAPSMLGGTAGIGALAIVVAVSDQVPVLLAAAGLAGICQSLVFLTYITARTNYVPDALLGRVGSTARTISLGLQPIGMLAGGLLIDLTSGSTTIALMGVVLIALALVFTPVAPLRRATTQPATSR